MASINDDELRSALKELLFSQDSLSPRYLFCLDASSSAWEIAETMLDFLREQYRNQLDIDHLQEDMERRWVALLDKYMTDDELIILDEVTHLLAPTGELSAKIISPPSRVGYLMLFDATLDMRLREIFTAPRNLAAWTAAYVRAAWGSNIDAAHWVAPRLDELDSITSGNIPDAYSFGTASNFIIAHECGHYFLNHLNPKNYITSSFGGIGLREFDPELQQELAADAYARQMLSRAADRLPLIVQQKGVDWLFGFWGAVLAMRERVRTYRSGNIYLPTMDRGLAERRRRSWENYNRLRVKSPDDVDRVPEHVATLTRLRHSIDEFNTNITPLLADIYAVLPEELMALQARFIETYVTNEDDDTAGKEVMTEEEVAAYLQDLIKLAEEAEKHHRAISWRRNWKSRLQRLGERFF